jgi:hypothetical protein
MRRVFCDAISRAFGSHPHSVPHPTTKEPWHPLPAHVKRTPTMRGSWRCKAMTLFSCKRDDAHVATEVFVRKAAPKYRPEDFSIVILSSVILSKEWSCAPSARPPAVERTPTHPTPTPPLQGVLPATPCHSDTRGKARKRGTRCSHPHSVPSPRHKSALASPPRSCKKDPDYEGVMAMRSHDPSFLQARRRPRSDGRIRP